MAQVLSSSQVQHQIQSWIQTQQQPSFKEYEASFHQEWSVAACFLGHILWAGMALWVPIFYYPGEVCPGMRMEDESGEEPYGEGEVCLASVSPGDFVALHIQGRTVVDPQDSSPDRPGPPVLSPEDN